MKKIRLDRLLILIFVVVGILYTMMFGFDFLEKKVSSSIAAKKVDELKTTTVTIQPQKVIAKNKIGLKKEIDQLLQSTQYQDIDIAIVIQELSSQTTSYARNVDQPFVAASIYKLPLAMVYFDEIEKGFFSLNTTLTLSKEDIDFESGVENYEVGESIDIETLLFDSIVYSSNTASHMLFNALGGWQTFLSKASIYSQHINYYELSETANIITAQFMNDLLNRIYKNQKRYSLLLKNLKRANRGEYLDYYQPDVEIAQKYGEYDGVNHIAGIVFSKKPYSIVIFTDGLTVEDAQLLIGEINKIALSYLNE